MDDSEVRIMKHHTATSLDTSDINSSLEDKCRRPCCCFPCIIVTWHCSGVILTGKIPMGCLSASERLPTILPSPSLMLLNVARDCIQGRCCRSGFEATTKHAIPRLDTCWKVLLKQQSWLLYSLRKVRFQTEAKERALLGSAQSLLGPCLSSGFIHLAGGAR